jgi:hypothetical protein
MTRPDAAAFAKMPSLLKAVAEWLSADDLSEILNPFGGLAKLTGLAEFTESAFEKHVWLENATHKSGVLDDGLCKAVLMHSLTAYASLMTGLEGAVTACGEKAKAHYAGTLHADMAKLSGIVVERIVALATQKFVASLTNGKAKLDELQLGLAGASWRASLPADAPLDQLHQLAVAELHGKHSFDNFEASVNESWKCYDQASSIFQHQGGVVSELDAQLVEPLSTLRQATATYVEWFFTLGLAKPKLLRNSVALMRYVTPLARLLDSRSVSPLLHPSVLAGIRTAHKQDPVL